MTQLEAVEMPPRIAKLRRDRAGRPVPWFVADIDGVPDFRIMDGRALDAAIREHRCWVCGERMTGPTAAFTTGPMCAVNRVSAEPPSHRECAVYSARVCPFLTNPKKRRREGHKPEGAEESPGGISIRRNPGVALVWVSRHWKAFGDGTGGILFNVGSPIRVLWFCEGREATHEEVMESIDSGLPILQEMAQKDGPDAEAELARMVDVAMALVPT
jgi:hypothetical protein